MPPATIEVVCAANAAFAVPLNVLIFSALQHSRPQDRLRFHIIDAGLDQRDRRRIEAMASRASSPATIEWLTPRMRHIASLPSRAGLPREAYLRLELGELLPASLERALWLDADIVVEAPLHELWQQPFDQQWLAAVVEYGGATVSAVAGTSATYRTLGLAPTVPYFNSGVMLIDLSAWRGESIGDRVIEYTQRFSQDVRHGDQDGLNAIVAGRWKRLDLTWNVQVAALRAMPRLNQDLLDPEVVRRRLELFDSARIVHFAGEKPWVSGLRSPFRARYFRYLARSGWFTSLQLSRYRAACLTRALLFATQQRLPWRANFLT